MGLMFPEVVVLDSHREVNRIDFIQSWRTGQAIEQERENEDAERLQPQGSAYRALGG